MQIAKCRLGHGRVMRLFEKGNHGGATHETLTSSATRSAERSSLAHAAGFHDGGGRSRAKKMCEVRKKVCPWSCWVIRRFFAFFSEAHAAPLEPWENCRGFLMV